MLFCNNFKSKRRCLARIAGTQKVFMLGPSGFLTFLESELVAEYHEIIRQEEVFGYQKARSK